MLYKTVKAVGFKSIEELNEYINTSKGTVTAMLGQYDASDRDLVCGVIAIIDGYHPIDGETANVEAD